MPTIEQQVGNYLKTYAVVTVIEHGGRELTGAVTAAGGQTFTLSHSERDHYAVRYDQVSQIIPHLSPAHLRAFRERFALDFEEVSRLTEIPTSLWEAMEGGTRPISYKMQPLLRRVGRELQGRLK
jgi:hypothetical protein